MTKSQTLLAVIKQLRELFLNKSDLRGYDDLDAFFGCINAIESVAIQLEETEGAEE